MSEHYRIFEGDVLDRLREMAPESIDCCITSPPYYGLRDYGIEPSLWGGKPDCRHEFGEQLRGSTRGGSGTPTDKNNRGEDYARSSGRGEFCSVCGAWRGCLGLEPTISLYVQNIVEVFREVRRVLKKQGTLWINIGDTYCSTAPGTYGDPLRQTGILSGVSDACALSRGKFRPKTPKGLKPKDRCMIPARVAIALCEDGWYLRDEIVWHKPNPMPQSVRDRTSPAHEMIYLLSRSKTYYYDQEAIREPLAPASILRLNQPGLQDQLGSTRGNGGTKTNGNMKAVVKGGRPGGRKFSSGDLISGAGKVGSGVGEGLEDRNKRSVWSVMTQSYPDAHFATWPEQLVIPMILAGCPPGGIVLDCFAGSFTTIAVAIRYGRIGYGIERSPAYIELGLKRLGRETVSLFGGP